MFKALVIAYYFPPMGLSGVQRTLKFTKFMSRFNWEPTVLTAGNTGYYAHDKRMLQEAENANIRIVRTDALDINSLLAPLGTVGMPKEIFRKFLSKLSKTFFIPDNKKSWAEKAFQTASELLEKEDFDVIFVTIPPFSSFMTAARLKKKFDIPVIVDYRDLWYGNQFAFYPTPYHKHMHKKLEYACLRASDKVIVINRKIKEKLLTTYKFLTFEDILILPHGFDQEELDSITPLPRDRNKIMLTYAGIFYEFITPKYFLKAFKQLSIERPDIAANFELHFVGHLRRENQKLINELALKEFVFEHGYLDHEESLRRILASDVLWMMIGNAPNADTISTGKLFEYFGARKPILVCVPEGVAKQAAKEYGGSIITKPDDIEEIKNALIKIYELYKIKSLPAPNEEFVLKHDRLALTEQLTKQFQFYLKAD